MIGRVNDLLQTLVSGLGRPSSRRRRAERTSRLALSVLERRDMPSGVPVPDWFAAAPAAAQRMGPAVVDRQRALAGVGEWILQLSPQALAARPGLSASVDNLRATSAPFEVVSGVGLPGQLLVRSHLPKERVESWLASSADVALFSPNQQVTIARDNSLKTTSTAITVNDPDFNLLWGLHNTGQMSGKFDADIDAAEAWELTRGDGQVIGVIDTGIDYNHPDLKANIWVNPGEIPGNKIDDDGNGFVDDVHGYDFYEDDGDPMDQTGHGTHVAGTIAAVQSNGLGVTGVAPNARLMALRFSGPMGGNTYLAMRAVNYATMMRSRGVNIRVTNNSWSAGGHDPNLFNAIEASGKAGILFVAAAGNSGKNVDVTPVYPGSYSSDAVLSVAATDRNEQLAIFNAFESSNYGAVSVDIGAPGKEIVSTWVGGGYATRHGTSMAAPHAAGVAALAWSLSPSATVAEVKTAIMQGVDPVPALQGKTVTGGRLNARATLDRMRVSKTIIGTAGFDQIIVRDQPANPAIAEVLVNGAVTFSRPWSSLSELILDGRQGNDTIHVTSARYGSEPLVVKLWGGDGNDTLIGSMGAEQMWGGTGDDRLEAAAGNDFLYGESGNDTIFGAEGDDRLEGGIGNDFLAGQTQNDTVLGEDGDDRIEPGEGDDFADAGAGNDVLIDIGGNDHLVAREGNDRVESGWGNDVVTGGAGDDTILCGPGDDNATGEGGADLVYGGDGHDVLTGAGEDDAVYGEAGSDMLYGEDGNDFVDGGDGSDQVSAGNGHDIVHGRGDRDIINGMGGNDTLYGEGGDDWIFGAEDHDTVYGGDGNDDLFGYTGTDVLLGEDGNDTIYGGQGNYALEADTGNDRLYGGNGDDYMNGQGGPDEIWGEAGNDKLYGEDGDDYLDGAAGGDEQYGGNGNDHMNGGGDRDIMNGMGGNDTMYGQWGDDWMFGAEGNDVISGEEGHDTLVGHHGVDSLYGSDGDDALYGASYIASHGDDGSIDFLYGGFGNDFIDGGAGDDWGYGHAGADTLVGGLGYDHLFGGADNDWLWSFTVNYYPGQVLDELHGEDGDDRVDGMVES